MLQNLPMLDASQFWPLENLVTVIDRHIMLGGSNNQFGSNNGNHPLTGIQVDEFHMHDDAVVQFMSGVSQDHQRNIVEKIIHDSWFAYIRPDYGTSYDNSLYQGIMDLTRDYGHLLNTDKTRTWNSCTNSFRQCGHEKVGSHKQNNWSIEYFDHGSCAPDRSRFTQKGDWDRSFAQGGNVNNLLPPSGYRFVYIDELQDDSAMFNAARSYMGAWDIIAVVNGWTEGWGYGSKVVRDCGDRDVGWVLLVQDCVPYKGKMCLQ